MKASSYFCLLLLVVAICGDGKRVAEDVGKILLKEGVKVVGLKGQDHMTEYRRTSPVLQLRCVAPEDLCSKYPISSAVCTHQGKDTRNQDIWKCEAPNVSDMVKIQDGSWTVSCEGYSFPDDPYVLAGSCGIEYSLQLSSPSQYYDYEPVVVYDWVHDFYYYYYYNWLPTGWQVLNALVLILIVAAISFGLMMLFEFCNKPYPTPHVFHHPPPPPPSSPILPAAPPPSPIRPPAYVPSPPIIVHPPVAPVVIHEAAPPVVIRTAAPQTVYLEPPSFRLPPPAIYQASMPLSARTIMHREAAAVPRQRSNSSSGGGHREVSFAVGTHRR